MSAHSIQLRGPWHITHFPGTVVESPPVHPIANQRSVILPCRPVQSEGTIRFSRFFNCPSGLESHDQVVVLVNAEGTLNAAFLDQTNVPRNILSDGLYEIDVSRLISGRHLLSLDFHPRKPASDFGAPTVTNRAVLLHSVWLEIRPGQGLQRSAGA